MSTKSIKATVYRSEPSDAEGSEFQTYEVPWEPSMSVMNVLDYIYQNLDSTIAYYDHAGCSLGICGKCTGKINGKPGLFCQTIAEGDILLEPLSKENVLKDLVVKKSLKPAKTDESPQPGDTDMPQDINSINMLVRREIESLIAAPIIRAFSEKFGKEEAENTVRKVIQGLSHESGKMLAAFCGGNSLDDLKKGLPLFSQGGALEFEILNTDDTEIRLNITRCRYAEMYKNNGLAEFGYLLSCNRDYALIKGFNPDITFTRKQTIMEGADYCDFCFSVKKDKE